MDNIKEFETTRREKIWEQIKEVYFHYEPGILLFLQPIAYDLTFIISLYVINLAFPDGDKNLYHTIKTAHEATTEYQLYPISWFLAALAFAYILFYKKADGTEGELLKELEIRDDMPEDEKVFKRFLNGISDSIQEN